MYNLKGINIDFETLEAPTQEDFVALGMFLDAYTGLMNAGIVKLKLVLIL
jgi:hypothetical protein